MKDFLEDDHNFRVDKSRSIFINLHPGAREGFAMRFGQRIGRFFIRNTQKDQLDIHAALRGIFYSGFQFTVQDEVRRHDMDIVLCAVQNIHIDRFTGFVLIQRAVSVGEHAAACVCGNKTGVFQKGWKTGSFLVT